MDRRWWWVAAGALVIVLVIGLLAWGGGDDTDEAGDDTTTSTSDDVTTTTSSTTTSITSTTTTTTAAPTTTITAAPPPSTTSTTGGPPPAAVTVVRAITGAGSGEVEVRWDAVPGATGYRVVKALSSGGPFTAVAEFDITTGAETHGPTVHNIWSEQHSYLPAREPLTAPDPSPWFLVVDVSGEPNRCFQVITLNDFGAAPPSAVVCGSPPEHRDVRSPG
jgi:hypothetical protein